MDRERLLWAYEKARNVLFEKRGGHRNWTGRLSDSALSTATAVSALSLLRDACYVNHAVETQQITVYELEYIEEILKKGVNWLVHNQNPDGGWGDTDKSLSNSSTTMLVKSALVLYDSAKARSRKKPAQARKQAKTSTVERGSSIVNSSDIVLDGRRRPPKRFGEPEHEPIKTTVVQNTNAFGQAEEKPGGLLRMRTVWQEGIGTINDVIDRADAYLKKEGGIDGIRKRYGKDKTFSVPILTNAALAGLVPWKQIDPLPFERAVFPQSMFRFLRLQVVSYAIPALVAIGQVKFHHSPPKSFLLRKIREWAIEPTLRKIQKMQPLSGGYLEATPLTAFVMMSLIACGKFDHLIVHSGLRFLLNSVSEDGAWPIDTNLATWVTTLSVNAIREPKKRSSDFELSAETEISPEEREVFFNRKLARWILSSQHLVRHPFTGASPGGWGWTDLSGAVPDADDTPSALLAIGKMMEYMPVKSHDEDSRYPHLHETLEGAAVMGIRWVLELQNSDGGIPTFCRGWGILPFDKSSVDLSAHAIRAFLCWKRLLASKKEHESLIAKMDKSIERAKTFMLKMQREDGSWLPLWFGNQYAPKEENPVYGTSKAVLGLVELHKHKIASNVERPIIKALEWFLKQQNLDGGWGCDRWDYPDSGEDKRIPISSIEESACALEAIAVSIGKSTFEKDIPGLREAYEKGLEFLVARVEDDRFQQYAPIGFYFASLWYYEELYPIIFTTAALARALDVTKE